jgi:long-chain fatty acid transport protein
VKQLALAALTAALTTPVALGARAGGIDQSGQPVTALFQEGGYAELSVRSVTPDIEGDDAAGIPSGNVYGSVTSYGAAIKADFGDRWSAALILDQPYGVRVDYPEATPAFAFAGTQAEPDSLGLTGLLRYRIGTRFSLHGGLRAGRFGGEATLSGPAFAAVGLAGYRWEGEEDWGLGYVLGAAYEVPEIALRVAVTYGSEIEHELDADESFFGPSTTEITMPRSLNLEFQTGISPTTLLYGSVRWVGWDGWNVSPDGFVAATGEPLVEFEADALTYKLGLGRQLTEAFAAGVEIAYEAARGEVMTALEPYDGYTTLAVGGTYALPSGVKLSGGLGYSFLGDAEVRTPLGAPVDFDGNHALSAQLKLALNF